MLGHYEKTRERINAAQTFYSKAINHFHESLEFKRRVYGDASDHWSIAYTLHFLGEIYFDVGNFEKSLEHLDNTLVSYTSSLVAYNKSLAIKKRLYAQHGVDGFHASIANTLHNIGTTYHVLGHLVAQRFLTLSLNYLRFATFFITTCFFW